MGTGIWKRAARSDEITTGEGEARRASSALLVQGWSGGAGKRDCRETWGERSAGSEGLISGARCEISGLRRVRRAKRDAGGSGAGGVDSGIHSGAPGYASFFPVDADAFGSGICAGGGGGVRILRPADCREARWIRIPRAAQREGEDAGHGVELIAVYGTSACGICGDYEFHRRRDRPEDCGAL